MVSIWMFEKSSLMEMEVAGECSLYEWIARKRRSESVRAGFWAPLRAAGGAVETSTRRLRAGSEYIRPQRATYPRIARITPAEPL